MTYRGRGPSLGSGLYSSSLAARLLSCLRGFLESASSTAVFSERPRPALEPPMPCFGCTFVRAIAFYFKPDPPPLAHFCRSRTTTFSSYGLRSASSTTNLASAVKIAPASMRA